MQDMDKLQILSDKEFRQKISQNPSQHATQLGIQVADDVDIVVVKNTKDTIYLPIGGPMGIQDSDMSTLNAAVKAGSVACASSVATLSSLATCIGTVGTAGTAGTVI